MSPSNTLQHRVVEERGGIEVVRFIIKFTATGQCDSIEHSEALLAELTQGRFDHVFVICHGWNNGWERANQLFDDMRDCFYRVHKQLGPVNAEPTPVRHLWVGLIWPSVYVPLPSEVGPKVAGTSPLHGELLDYLADGLSPVDQTQLKSLAQRSELDEQEALALATILFQFLGPNHEEVVDDRRARSPEALLAAWYQEQDSEQQAQPNPGGIARFPTRSGTATGPGAAAGRMKRVLRNVADYARSASVWKMKDRAGVVGSVGVSVLLHQLRAATSTPIHLLGHSYGCQVILAAVATDEWFATHQFNSILLLQPAVSAVCFGLRPTSMPDPGAFRVCADRVQQPILLTFSANDRELHDWYHLAVTRRRDLLETAPKAGAAIVPLFAALGGYGPQKTDIAIEPVAIQQPPQAYDFSSFNQRIIPLNGTGVIMSHGDVTNDATGWALSYQVQEA